MALSVLSMRIVVPHPTLIIKQKQSLLTQSFSISMAYGSKRPTLLSFELQF